MANLISQINASLKKIRDPIIRERLLLVRAAQKQPLREVGKTFLKKNKSLLARQSLDWTIVVQDESIFIYDVKIRKVWAIKGSKPLILTTGSKKKVVLFGALGEWGISRIAPISKTYP